MSFVKNVKLLSGCDISSCILFFICVINVIAGACLAHVYHYIQEGVDERERLTFGIRKRLKSQENLEGLYMHSQQGESLEDRCCLLIDNCTQQKTVHF